MSSELPYVSVCTPTFNRRPFFQSAIQCFNHQTYPMHRMEWIIIDDGTDKIEDLVASHPNVKYFKSSEKMTLGKKRNLMHANSCGDIIVYMDDDDYYPPTRVSTAVDAFKAEPEKQIAGCSKVYMYFQQENEVHSAGPYSDTHALNCTIAFRSSYLKNHRYDAAEVCAVERVFTNDFSEPMIQLDSKRTILHMVHAENTFKEKKKIGLLVKTTLGLSDF